MWYRPCEEIEGDHLDHVWALVTSFMGEQITEVYVCSGDKGSRELQGV